MAKEEIEHKRRRDLIIILMALLVAFLAVIIAQNAQDTADINNVFEVVVNNTNLAPAFIGEPPGTGERVTGTTYFANSSPIQLMVFAHASAAGGTATVEVWINNTMVQNQSGRPLASPEQTFRSVAVIVPKFSSYSVNFSNYHHYEWREYPILSGKNGTLNVTQILNASGDFIPYLGANKNVTVGVNNFTIFSMDGNSSIYLPNTTHGGIVFQQYLDSSHTQYGAVYINGTVQMTRVDTATPLSSTYIIASQSHSFKINNTDKAVINKNGLTVSNITSVGINNGDYPNSSAALTNKRNFFTQPQNFTSAITINRTEKISQVHLDELTGLNISILGENMYFDAGGFELDDTNVPGWIIAQDSRPAQDSIFFYHADPGANPRTATANYTFGNKTLSTTTNLSLNPAKKPSCITMYSPDGTAYRLTIANGGTTNVAVGTCG